MSFCVGIFLTALKICKSASIKQKVLGTAVFRSLYPDFNCEDDDSAISAVFRGKRNLNSYLQLMIDDLKPAEIVSNFERNVIPLLDENSNSLLIRLLQKVIKEDSIDDETHVELVNHIKKKDFIHMDDIVISEFLVGVLLYAIKNTDNLRKEAEVKAFIACANEMRSVGYKKANCISHYSANLMFHDDKIRPIYILYKQSGNAIDVIKADIFETYKKHIPFEKAKIVIPVNTTFETKLEEKIGDNLTPLVSANTLHGQWINFIHKNGINIANIDKAIENSLKQNGFTKCSTSVSVNGKQSVYPIASIANITVKNIDFYLTAISRFEKNNRAVSDITAIKKSIQSILSLYDIEGQGYDLYIPLVGSGRSRTGMSADDSFTLIKNILLERKKDIYGRVHIVIHPDLIEEIKLEV